MAFVLQRANAMTCSGCHQTATGQFVAPEVKWPQDAGFVHITEAGELSAALKDHFLPARRSNLAEHLCKGAPLPIFSQVAAERALVGKVTDFTKAAKSDSSLTGQLDEAIKNLRNFEASQPGAFSRFRSVH